MGDLPSLLSSVLALTYNDQTTCFGALHLKLCICMSSLSFIYYFIGIHMTLFHTSNSQIQGQQDHQNKYTICISAGIGDVSWGVETPKTPSKDRYCNPT